MQPSIDAIPIGSNLAALANPTYKGLPAYTGAWKDCAYDPELPGPIYHADQVRVPTELQGVVRDWTKAVVVSQPDDVIGFSQKWFAQRAEAARPSKI